MKLISNIPATKLLNTKLDPSDKIIFFSIAWSPIPEDKTIIALTQKGDIFVIDYHKRKIISKTNLTKGKYAMNSVDWNLHNG